MNNIKEILDSLGLENNESIVYLEAIKLGTVPASIIANKLKLPRTTIRYACESLVKKGLLISITKGNTKLFTAEHPNKIKNLLQVEKNKLEEKENKLNKVMSDMLQMYNPYTKLPKVTFYEGLDPVMKMLINNHSKIKDDTYEFSAHIQLLNKFPKEIGKYTDIHMKNKKGFKNHVIDSIENKKNNDEEPYSEDILSFKYYKDKNLDINTHIQIDGDRIAIISNHDKEPLGIDIHHKKIADDFIKIFKQLEKLL